MNFKNSKLTHILFASQPASQPNVIPGTLGTYMASEFLHSKVNYVAFTYETVFPKNFYPLCHSASFYPLLRSWVLSSNHLQKGEKLTNSC